MVNNGAVMEMAATLQKVSRLLLVGHLSPDGDSLGSLLALGQVLRDMGKVATVFVPEGIPEKYRFLPGSDSVVSEAACLPQEPCTVVILDCGEWERTGLPKDPFQDYPILNIDHHRTSRGMGQHDLIDATAAATGELIYLVLVAMGALISPETATCLYTALVSDTGWFRFSNTSPDSHLLAAELIRAGACLDIVNDCLMTMTGTYLQALALLLSRLTTSSDGQSAISWLTHHDLEQIGICPSEIEGLIDYPRALPGVQVAALLVETRPGTCKVSFRSRQAVDVSELAKEFGGGGHARAAGCTISPCELDHCLLEIRAAMARGLSHVTA